MWNGGNRVSHSSCRIYNLRFYTKADAGGGGGRDSLGKNIAGPFPEYLYPAFIAA